MLLLLSDQHPQCFLLKGATTPRLSQQMNTVAALSQLESLKRPHERLPSVLGEMRRRVPVDPSLDLRVRDAVVGEVAHPSLEDVVADRRGCG